MTRGWPNFRDDEPPICEITAACHSEAERGIPGTVAGLERSIGEAIGISPFGRNDKRAGGLLQVCVEEGDGAVHSRPEIGEEIMVVTLVQV